LNLLLFLKEQRSMQLIQPAHLEESAVIKRLSLLTPVVIQMDYNRKPSVHALAASDGFLFMGISISLD
jgi:hypothetical protein